MMDSDGSFCHSSVQIAMSERTFRLTLSWAVCGFASANQFGAAARACRSGHNSSRLLSALLGSTSSRET